MRTGLACSMSQVCGGWRCPFPGHQAHGKTKGTCPGMTICPHQWVRPLSGVGIGCRLSLGDVLSYCFPTELMGFIPLGSPVGLALCPTINCINSKGYLSILHRQQEMMVPNLGCGGGGGFSQRALFVFVHFPDCVAENTFLLCPPWGVWQWCNWGSPWDSQCRHDCESCN